MPTNIRGLVPYAPCPQGCSGHLFTVFILQRGGIHEEHREQDNAKRGEWRQGGAEENACKSEVQAGMRSTCRARARMQEGGKEREGKGRKKGKRRLSALGSQDALVKARPVGLASMRALSCSSTSEKHSREGRCSQAFRLDLPAHMVPRQ